MRRWKSSHKCLFSSIFHWSVFTVVLVPQWKTQTKILTHSNDQGLLFSCHCLSLTVFLSVCPPPMYVHVCGKWMCMRVHVGPRSRSQISSPVAPSISWDRVSQSTMTPPQIWLGWMASELWESTCLYSQCCYGHAHPCMAVIFSLSVRVQSFLSVFTFFAEAGSQNISIELIWLDLLSCEPRSTFQLYN